MNRTLSSTALVAVALVAAVTAPALDKAFTDHGVGAQTGEMSGLVRAVTKDGHNLLICTVFDMSKLGYLLVTDIDTGETEQIFCPKAAGAAGPSASLMHTNGKFYHGRGKMLLEFDPETREFTWYGVPSKNSNVFLNLAEAPDGKIWGGGVYKCTLISFDPKTREMKDHGRMDPKEVYLFYLAADDKGWIYCGVGTARQGFVAYNTATGEKRQLLAEEKRTTGTAYVYPGEDGAVYGRTKENGQFSYYRLLDGAATAIKPHEIGRTRKVTFVTWGGISSSFPDGRRVTKYSLSDKIIKIRNTKTEETATIPFEFEGGGVLVTSLGLGPNDTVYGSTCHPMHLLAVDAKTGVLTDIGHIPPCGGGNWCAIAAQGDLVIGAHYSKGKLWLYDTNKPFTWKPDFKPPPGIISATELAASVCDDNPDVEYSESMDLVVFETKDFGTEAHFPFQVPADGTYYLHAFPNNFRDGCTVQWLLDGKDTGQQYVPVPKQRCVGPMFVFGPLQLTAGEHRIGVRTVKTEGQDPKTGLCALALDTRPLDESVVFDFRNPHAVSAWRSDICRPRTALAHPDGKHVMMAGYADYGLCGGGIGIYNLETRERTLLSAENDLLPGQSCITLKALPNGDLVGGTAIGAPGGGHKTATEAELFILDWNTKEITFHAAPVPGSTNITSIYVLDNGLVYGLTGDAIFFVFDPETKKVLHTASFAEYGQSTPRHALQPGPDGNLYALMTFAVLRVNPATFTHELVTKMPVSISTGGPIVNGLLFFGNGSHVWSYKVPGL